MNTYIDIYSMSNSLPNTDYWSSASGMGKWLFVFQPQPAKNTWVLINIQNEDATCFKNCIERHAFKIFKEKD